MSFLAIPASVQWLQTADDNTVQLQHYRICLADHAEWLRASGVDPSHIADPVAFVQDGDLQLHSNVVSEWAHDAPPTHRAPKLYDILQHLRTTHANEPVSFQTVLDWYSARLREWAVANRRDPDNLNETKAEREARLNRERVARHRLRHAAGSDDPQLDGLIKAAKAADANAVAGKRWLKGEIQQAKLDMDAAIARAKADRSERVARAEAAVLEAEAQARSAKEAVDSYRINK